ncbi:MAG TPA: hypothetical protein VLM36_06990 [Sphingomicrobium sp.]|nr:hypothetical protein [Sphingomicrobium sp.]
MKLGPIGFALALALTSCGPRREPQQPANNASAPVLPSLGAPSAPSAVANDAGPAAPEKAAIDPKSREAASELVGHFVDLLNRRRFGEAYMLLGPNAPPRGDFDRQFSRYRDLKVAAGAAGDEEGAAGSIYLSVPLTVSGTLDQNSARRSATAIVRRVNDVPGSSEAQRRWHIERIDWGNSP